jgi:hypothetical protein
VINYLDGKYTLENRPLKFQRMGLRYTASGYGSKIPSERVVKLPDGRVRRVYITCYSNNQSAWIILKGKKIFIM